MGFAPELQLLIIIPTCIILGMHFKTDKVAWQCFIKQVTYINLFWAINFLCLTLDMCAYLDVGRKKKPLWTALAENSFLMKYLMTMKW